MFPRSSWRGCSLQKKDVLFLGPSMSLMTDQAFYYYFFNLSLLLHKAINEVWLTWRKVNKFLIIYNSVCNLIEYLHTSWKIHSSFFFLTL